MGHVVLHSFLRRLPGVTVLGLASVFSLLGNDWAWSQDAAGAPPARGAAPQDARGGRGQGQPENRPLGLVKNEPGAFQGYTLLAPIQSTTTYLVDMQGRVVRTWKSDMTAGHTAVLLENGNMLRAGEQPNPPWGAGPGAGGRIQEFDWDGNIVWDFRYTTDTRLPHHDFVKLPNGNIVMIIREKKTAEEAIAVGRRPETLRSGELQPDALIEVKRTGPTTAEIVWEWHIWDHLIQDHDSTKANYGEVAKHPELVDINFGSGMLAAMVNDPAGREQLRSIGYLGGAGAGEGDGDRRGAAGARDGRGRGPAGRDGRGRGGRGGRGGADWTHTNSIAYNAELDQLMLSIHEFSEVWIIDHSTTTAEAAGHTGGRSGKGGDLLYRWGNPIAYRAGKREDQRLFAQHHAQWIAKGLPGAGNMLLFNNGNGRPDGQYSTVDEIELPVDAQGRYKLELGKSYGPERAGWSYSAPNKSDFFSNFISGAQRLANGNTLICSGASGTLFEVTPAKEIVWQFNNPTRSDRGRRGGPGGGPGGPGGGPGGPGGGPGGPGGFGGGPGPAPQIGIVLPPFFADALSLNDEQRGKLGALQTETDAKLNEILNEDQEKQIADLRSGTGFSGVSQPGQVLSPFQQTLLTMTDEQKTQLGDWQKQVDEKLRELLGEEQRTQLAQMGRGAGGGVRDGFAGGPDGRGRGRGNRGGRGGGGGGPQGSSVFRVYRYAADYPGLSGRDLTPGKTLEEISRATPTTPPQDGPRD
jgi:hypothetical protein